jgi:hypothetical protein
MDVTWEITALRQWLRDDEKRLQSPIPRRPESLTLGSRSSTAYNFNDHSKWHDLPGGGWKDWPNWSNGGQ